MSRYGCFDRAPYAANHKFFAIGSGRDYALAAMHLGTNSRKAVEVAIHFDNNTGGEVIEFGVDE